MPYPDESLVRAGLEKFGLASQGLGAGNLIYEQRPNLNDPNKTPIVFARDPVTKEVVLATRLNQQTKELEWHVAGLRDLADAVGMRIGTNLSSPYFSSSKIAAHDKIVLEEFNHAIIDQFAMHQMAPTGQFNFAAAEKVINLAKANGMAVGPGSLLYGYSDIEYTFLKKYWQLAERSGFKAAINNLSWDEVRNMNADPVYGQKRLESLIDSLPDPETRKELRQARAELRDYIIDYVKTIVGKFKGQVNIWIVVNEFDINPQSTWDPYFWLVGPDYPDLAFQAAREADPTAILITNQQSRQYDEQDWAYSILSPVVERLKQKGLIDGVGEMGHEKGSQPFAWERLFTLLKKYGLEILITERDFDLRDVPGSDKERFELQARKIAESLRSAMKNGVRLYTFWECFGDSDSWLERHADGDTRADPTLFDDNGNPKPAYFAVKKVLEEKINSE